MSDMTYATVCSGIECMSAAAIGLPLRPVFFSEIEPFPCSLLKHRYPTVPNLGDMGKIKVNEKGEITNGRTTVTVPGGRLDILAGGTPCQDVSNAGKRRGMQEGSGTRSSLAFEFVRLVRELRPRYVVWENVAGVLSDESFPKFLTALAECGYGLAYRVLDAQWIRCADIDLPDGGVVRLERAVPQRRRRVWVVGCAGGDAGAASEILFEPRCVCGDRPPRRVPWQGTAEAARGRTCLPDGVVGRASGFDPYEPGGVRTLNPGLAGTLINGSCPGCRSGVVEVYENHAQDCRVKPCDEAAPTIGASNANGVGTGGNNPLVVSTSVEVGHAECFGINANGVTETAQMPFRKECEETLAVRHQGGVLVPDVASMRYVVRHLTPTECERLMGLPDGWTLPAFAPDEITDALVDEFRLIHDTFGAVMAGYAGKNPPKPKAAAWVRKWLERIANPKTCPDAPRYKACGNGWATNQPRWILMNLLERDSPGWQFECWVDGAAPASRPAFGADVYNGQVHDEVADTIGANSGDATTAGGKVIV